MKVQIDELTFEKMLKATKSFVSADNYRSILKYIRLDVKPSEIIVSALDGYRATRIHFPKESAEEFTVYFTPFDFKASKSGSRLVSISKENGVCKIEVETLLFTEAIYQFKQPNEKVVDIHKVFDKQNCQSSKIAVNAAIFAKSLNALKEVSNDSHKTAIIEIGGNCDPIIIKNNDKDFSIEELILPIRLN